MLFGLKNDGSTFQRVMAHAFKDLIRKLLANYQDDLTVHVDSRHLHFKHLREVLTRCKMFGIYLNPNKCLLVDSEAQLLGNIISGKGYYIDLERIQDINELNPLLI